MPLAFPLLEAAEALRPVRVLGRPIFRRDCAEYTMFYAPGCLCVVAGPDADHFEATIDSSKTYPKPEAGDGRDVPLDWAAELCRQAGLATAEVDRWQRESFEPECLTLYMNNECNLNCVYCHTDPSPQPVARLGLDVIAAAGEVVAASCRRKGVPFSIVFHGGGEPTMHRQRVDRAMVRLEAIAAEHEVDAFRYVATNGVMSEQKARWLAGRFDLVGLSCDGPAEVQDRQRPRRGGGSTSRALERTAHILCEAGCRYNVRTTITRATVGRQAEIADYICQRFAPEEIHFEPVYVGGRTRPSAGLDVHHAHEFVTSFLEAREVARKHDVPLISSGSRPGVIHGPYCHVFRHVLNLLPGDVATACFKLTLAAQVEDKGAAMGRLNRASGRFEIDQLRVQALRRQLDVALPKCDECFNRYHCARECPDLCPLDDGAGLDYDLLRQGFRCLAQKAMAYATLREAAERLWSETLADRARQDGEVVHGERRPIVRGTTIF